jgi:hypothetical protein
MQNFAPIPTFPYAGKDSLIGQVKPESLTYINTISKCSLYIPQFIWTLKKQKIPKTAPKASTVLQKFPHLASTEVSFTCTQKFLETRLEEEKLTTFLT